MNKDTFTAIIQNELATAPRSYGDNLLGFRIDLDAYLTEFDIFVDDAFEVKETDDQFCLLNVLGKVNPSINDPEIVIQKLEKVWEEYLRYRDFESHYIERSADKIVFNFVTTIVATLCVTGKIEVVMKK